MEKIYVVVKHEVWDGDTYNDICGAYHNEDEAVACVRELANDRRADWVNECIDEGDGHFSAWRDGEYMDYHCSIYVVQTALN